MILSDVDIKNEIANKNLVFSPKLKPEQIGGSSVDLTLDSQFWTFKKSVISKKVIDLKKDTAQNCFDEHRWNFVILEPGALILGITKEKIKLASHIMGTLEGRSRYARMGLAVHVTSALIQAGAHNRQVLEIVNMGPKPIRMYAGMRISQVVFCYLNSPTSKAYSRFGKIAIKQ